MEKIQNNKEEINDMLLFVCTSLGFNIDIGKMILTDSQKIDIKKELIESLKYNSCFATLLVEYLVNQVIDIELILKYKDKPRVLYQLIRGLRCGMDISFLKEHIFTAEALDQIISTYKKGIDITDLVFEPMSPSIIKTFVSLKEKNIPYDLFLTKPLHKKYLRNYLKIMTLPKVQALCGKEKKILIHIIYRSNNNLHNLLRFIGRVKDLSVFLNWLEYCSIHPEYIGNLIDDLFDNSDKYNHDAVEYFLNNLNEFNCDVNFLEDFLIIDNLETLKKAGLKGICLYLRSKGLSWSKEIDEELDLLVDIYNEDFPENIAFALADNFNIKQPLMAYNKGLISGNLANRLLVLPDTLIRFFGENTLALKAYDEILEFILSGEYPADCYDEIDSFLRRYYALEGFSTKINFSYLNQPAIPKKNQLAYMLLKSYSLEPFYENFKNMPIHLLKDLCLSNISIENIKKIKTEAMLYTFLNIDQYENLDIALFETPDVDIECLSTNNLEYLNYFHKYKSEYGFAFLANNFIYPDTLELALDAMSKNISIKDCIDSGISDNGLTYSLLKMKLARTLKVNNYESNFFDTYLKKDIFEE